MRMLCKGLDPVHFWQPNAKSMHRPGLMTGGMALVVGFNAVGLSAKEHR
jgi:hypothetical protein